MATVSKGSTYRSLNSGSFLLLWRKAAAQVYEYCNAGLPNQFLAFLDTAQASLNQLLVRKV